MKAIKITGSVSTLTLFLALAACGGGGGSAPVTQDAPPLKGGTTFNQTLEATDNTSVAHPFPGQPNIWDLDLDFSLGDGGDDQFDAALQLGINGTPFPADQTYEELTFSGPYLFSDEGVKVAAVAFDSLDFPAMLGNYSAWLGGIYDARLQQTVDLSGLAAPIMLGWWDDARIDPGHFVQGNDPYYRVVIRDLAGTLLETLYEETYPVAVTLPKNHFFPIDNYAGQKIVISFEQRGSNLDGSTLIDEVSVVADSVELVINGDFELGTSEGWTTNTPQELQNVTSGVRPLEGLNVTRSFYTVPNRLWGRWVDVFENPGVTPVIRTVTYTTNLGHDNNTAGAGTGMIAYTPGKTGALSSWDNLAGDRDRDVGLVFGNGAIPVFKSAEDINTASGNDLITVSHTITVPALGRKSLVNFVVMNGVDTGEKSAVSDLDRPVEIDVENIRILEGYGIDLQYQEGMTREQIESVVNF